MSVHRHQQDFRTKQSNILFFGLFGVAIGGLTPIAIDQLSASNFWPSLALVVIPFVLLLAARPVFGAVAVVGFAFVNTSLLPPLIELGELSLRYVDGVFGLLICMVVARMAIRRRLTISPEFRELFAPLLLFILYIGISLLIVPFSAPNSFPASVASYMRLVLTASFVPILYVVLRDKRDMHLFHNALIVFAIATVGIGSWLAWVGLESGETEALGARFGGVLGTSSFGLVSGLLILHAVIKRHEKPRSLEWAILLALGLLGLFLNKSAISIFATAGATSVYLTAMHSYRSSGHRVLRGATVGTIITTAAILAVLTLREGAMTGFTNLSGGSFAERLMIAYAGLLIFLDNPLIGVGWHASTTEAVANSVELSAAVIKKFPGVAAHYFLEEPPPSLHNMYIQFGAELGIIGVALFAWVCFRTGKNIARIVGNVPAASPYKVCAQFYALGLIFLLIWWNGNPLYGGQTEAVLAFTFLAVLANLAQLEKQRVEQIQAGK